jgi:hypothetical protein
MGVRVEGIGRDKVGEVAMPEIEIVVGDLGPDVGVGFGNRAHAADGKLAVG